LNEYLKRTEALLHLSSNYKNQEIIAIRNHILNDIDFTSPHVAKARPKIGWSVKEIIKKREGLCGEGARLLFHILTKRGINSRRVYLHGNTTLHVILECKINNKWVLLETINGPGDDFKDHLDSLSVGINNLFSFGPYRYYVVPTEFTKKFGFNNFSYLPLNGLFNNSLLKTEIYVHRPLPYIINYLLESPELAKAFFGFVLLFLLNVKMLMSKIRGHSFYGKKQV